MYIELIIAILTFLGVLLPLIATLVKSESTKKKLLWVARLTEKVKEYVEIAEVEQIGKPGADKKAFVFSSLKLFCAQNKIPYDEILISSLIENFIKFSKQVNVK